MKILLACLNVNGLGGSELYHYELARELQTSLQVSSQRQGLSLFSLKKIDAADQVRRKLTELGIRQLDQTTLDSQEEFDLIVASQPETVKFVLDKFPNTPIISIIHSEIKSENPVMHRNVKHYIAIRPSIVFHLRNNYGIPASNISLIYNPIDKTRFNLENINPVEKTTGLFVGEVLDPIRFRTVQHLVKSCIEQDMNLLLMSKSKYDFNHPNISYIPRRWNTEEVLKTVHFTAGILVGRTTLESWCCGIPSSIYNIDYQGIPQSISLEIPENITELCDSVYVAQSHLALYTKILYSPTVRY